MQNLNFLKTVYFCAAILFMQIASPVQARTDTNTNVLILNSYHKGTNAKDFGRCRSA